ncbi:MAG: hypothetical protein WAN28_03775 [Terracidiphilus sp.]
MTIFCSQCGFTDLLASRLRLADWRKLLLLQFPVRCRTCRHRMFASLPRVLHLSRRRVALKIARLHHPVEP